jgi:hypothetical protein
METITDHTKQQIKTREVADSFRDTLASVDNKGKRKWIYTQKPKGKFY